MGGRFFSRSFGGGRVRDLGDVKPPWGDRPSLYEHVRAHLLPAGLSPEGENLPDDEAGAGEIRFAPGARDGALGHHASGEDESAADHIFAALTDLLAEANDDNLSDLYRALTRSSALETLDTVLQRLADDSSADAARAHELALYLATGAADRQSPADDLVHGDAALARWRTTRPGRPSARLRIAPGRRPAYLQRTHRRARHGDRAGGDP